MEEFEAITGLSQTSKPIKLNVPDTIKTEHATHLVVQQQGSEFTLLFFEVQQPLLTGTAEEQLTAFGELPFVEAKCISRIVMSAENVAQATNNLIEVLNRFNTLLRAGTKG